MERAGKTGRLPAGRERRVYVAVVEHRQPVDVGLMAAALVNIAQEMIANSVKVPPSSGDRREEDSDRAPEERQPQGAPDTTP
jgi:hypothetical protein